MSTDGSFDPYEKWLGIPRHQQPPDHYRLLGLEAFEQDRGTIQRHAEQRLRQVQMYRRGPHVRICDELVHKINVAKACLLNPSLKPSYDQKLRTTQAGAPAAVEELTFAPETKAGLPAGKPATARPAKKRAGSESLPDLASDSMDLDKLFGPAPPSQPRAAPSPSPAPAGDPLDLDNLFAPVPSPQPKATAASSSTSTGETVDPLDLVIDGDDIASLVEDFVEPEPQRAAKAEPQTPAAAKPAGAAKPAAAKPSGVAKPAAAKPKQSPSAAGASKGGSQVLAAGTSISGATQVAPRKSGQSPRQPAPTTKPPAEDPGYEVLDADEPAAAPDDGGYEVVAADDGEESQTGERARRLPAALRKFLAGVTGQHAGRPLTALWKFMAGSPETSHGRRPAARLRFLASAVVLTGLAAIVLYLAMSVWSHTPSAYSKPMPRSEIVSRKRSPEGAERAPSKTSGVPQSPQTPARPAAVASQSEAVEAPQGDPQKPIEIGVAFGTEKRTWFDWAAQEFASRKEGAGIQINLIPLGSEEAAHAILDADRRIHVWSPASSLYGVIFRRDWEAKGRVSPFAKQEKLALTPMVFVMWKSRYQAFLARCPEVSLKTIDFAMQTKAGWAQIAAKPQWGRFKFSHTHPNQSNSGLMTLLLMSYEYFHKTSDLSVRDIMTEGFQDHLEGFERGVIGMSDSTGGLTKLLSHSTGDLMKEMVLEGPSRYDALLVYESVAIDYLSSAEGRWEPLQVIYPPCNLWSENPYYVLNTPWTTPAHQKAAEAFLKFLMSEPAQAKALEHGFRPGNPTVTIKKADSPFVRYAANGLAIEVSSICEVPAPEVIDNLLESWIRNTAPAAR
jgi:hypothetical protein